MLPSWKLDHIGHAVHDLEVALKTYQERGNLQLLERESVPTHGVDVAFLESGSGLIELLAPQSENSLLSRFLQKHGEGLHHLCFEVSDIESELAKLKQRGDRLVDETPRPGSRGCLVAFLHPSVFSGVLVELCQYKR